MYLDIDLHFSDAVSECFYKSGPEGSYAQALTLSIHHTAPGFYPVHELAALPDPASDSFDPFTLSIPLKQGASSATLERVWKVVEAVKNAYSPDYVVIQCGADGLAGDPHGIWNWSAGEGRRGDMDWCIGQVINNWRSKILLLGGGVCHTHSLARDAHALPGGYNHPNTARAWAQLTGVAVSILERIHCLLASTHHAGRKERHLHRMRRFRNTRLSVYTRRHSRWMFLLGI